MTFFDTNVVLDILDRDPVWASWSSATMLFAATPLLISPMVYAELAGRIARLSDLDGELHTLRLTLSHPSRAALFSAGRAHAAYRRRGGARQRVLADFLIGAQSLEEGAALATRDPRRYQTDFPGLRLISP